MNARALFRFLIVTWFAFFLAGCGGKKSANPRLVQRDGSGPKRSSSQSASGSSASLDAANLFIQVKDAEAVSIRQMKGWKKTPSYLNGATVLAPAWVLRGTSPETDEPRVFIKAKESGTIVLAASWWYDGTERYPKLGPWFHERTTRIELAKQGWIPIGVMHRQEQRRAVPYWLFRRNVQAGESFEFHTRMLTPPFVLIPAKASLQSVLAQNPTPVFSQDLDYVKFSKAKPGENIGQAGSDTLMLDLHEADPYSIFLKPGILFRELVRQALMLSARDEFGLATRDRGLREGFLTSNTGQKNSRISVLTSVIGRKLKITVLRESGERFKVLWDESIALPDTRFLIEIVAEKAEALSRTEFPKLLQENGFSGERNRTVERREVPPEIEKSLADLNFVAQFAALRNLHALIKKDGESPQLLAAVARGYANLGSLTEFHWSPAYKSYFARAILYAERLVQRKPKAAFSYLVRGYVRGLVGLHKTAIEDIDKARKMAASKKLSEPDWGTIMYAFLTYDRKTRSRFEEHSLAMYLDVLLTERSKRPVEILKAAGTLHEQFPDCFRAIDAMYVGFFDAKKAIANDGPNMLARTLWNRVQTVPGLPPSIHAFAKKTASRREKESESKQQEAANRHQTEVTGLVLQLKKAGQTDRQEPSLAVLGQLIQEVSFVHAYRQTIFTRTALAQAPDAIVAAWRPVILDHPYHWFLETLVFDQNTRLRAFNKQLKEIRPDELVIATNDLVRQIYRSNRKVWTPLGRALDMHLDIVFRDQTYYMFQANAGSDRLNQLRLMRQLCPHMPISISRNIDEDWEYSKKYAKEWEKKYSDNAAVQGSLAARYKQLKQPVDAIRCLKRQLELAPQRPAFEMLAEFYLDAKEPKKWLETLEKYLEMPDVGSEGGSDHAQVRIRIAQYFLKQKDYKTALMYVTEASKTVGSEPIKFIDVTGRVASGWPGHAWTSLVAGDCNEALGNWNEAEAHYRALTGRYHGMMEWLFFCHRTGKGNLKAAQKATLAALEPENRDTWARLHRLAVTYMLTDQKKKALEKFQQIGTKFKKDSQAYSFFHIALLADELKMNDLRDQMLLRTVRTARKAKLGGLPRLEMSRLARVLYDDLHGPSAGKLNHKVAADVIRKSRQKKVPTDLYYFLGKYLTHRGKIKEGHKYIQHCATSPIRNNNCVRHLAIQYLRANKIKIEKVNLSASPPKK